MRMRQRHFLIIFDGAKGEMRERVRSFAEQAPAVQAYSVAERRYEREPEVQVVLVAADSLATVKATHPNFWRSDFVSEARKALKRAAG